MTDTGPETCTTSDGIVFPAAATQRKDALIGANWKCSKRSTTSTARSIYQAAIDAASPQQQNSTAAPFKMASSSSWRFGYKPTVVHTTTLMARSGCTLQMAQAGLEFAHTSFTFRRKGFPEMSLSDACSKGTFTGSFVTGQSSTHDTAKATKSAPTPEFSGVPYQGKEYRGTDLVELAQSFVADGQAEPSFASSIQEVVDSNHLDTIRGKVFILIGATSEMGPTQALLRLGATVIALARPASARDPTKWSKLVATAAASPGEMLYPTRSANAGLDQAGADALADTPEIINWLVEVCTSHPLVQGQKVHIYSGIYLDGGKFVRASMAMEMIISELTKRLPSSMTPSLLYIDTPSHAHTVKRATYDGHIEQRRNAPFLMNMLFQCGIVSDYPSVLEPGGRDDVVVMDFLATQQGPNYALAKLLQKWRALWSRNSTTLLFGKGKKSKQLVSMTLGPAARTESVMHSKTMALIMNTMHHVRPNVAHAPETVQSMMTLVMVRDLCSSMALGNPKVEIAHPTDFLVENAWHGGMWRSPYSMESVGYYCVLKHYVTTYLVPLLLLVAGACYFLL